MKSVNNIKVSLRFSKEDRLVGELVEDKGLIYFKYAPEFLTSNLELSPYNLPLKEGVQEAPLLPFEGLFGVFEDSLPDGWGRLLLDRKLLKQGIVPQEINPLDRLTYIGENGSGALVYHPSTAVAEELERVINLEEIEQEAYSVYEGTSEEVLDKLFDMGGSSGGARPKIWVGYNPETKHLINEVNELPEGYEHWMVKFPSTKDLPDIAQVEYAYYLMALDAGLEMTDSTLLTGESGKKYFATKRFDRVGNERLHMHSAAGLLHDDFRKSGLDYGHLMDAAFTLEKDIRVYKKVLRLCAFNVFAHNRDDHSKNFSFLMNEQGKWKFSPVYDLTFSSSSHGMHSTTIAGEGEHPKKKHILELAQEFDVKGIDQLIEEVANVIDNWESYAKEANVSKETTKLIKQKMEGVRK